MEKLIITKLVYEDGYTLEGVDLIRFLDQLDFDDLDDDTVFYATNGMIYFAGDLVGVPFQVYVNYCFE